VAGEAEKRTENGCPQAVPVADQAFRQFPIAIAVPTEAGGGAFDVAVGNGGTPSVEGLAELDAGADPVEAVFVEREFAPGR